MNTVNEIPPLSPVLPSRTRVRYIPARKPREERPSPPPERSTPDEENESTDDNPHIDEYA